MKTILQIPWESKIHSSPRKIQIEELQRKLMTRENQTVASSLDMSEEARSLDGWGTKFIAETISYISRC